MRFQTQLVRATLLRRYKRFLADIRLEDNREVTAHCANPGAMTGLAAPGTRIWVEPNDNPRKKLKYAWRLVELEGTDMACVDTSLPNRLVKTALHQQAIAELAGYPDILPEQRVGTKSRVDFVLRGARRREAWLEVKSVTLSRRPALAEFPDTVTARGTRHMQELATVARAGHRAILLFVVQRTDCTSVAVAADIDPVYADAVAAACAAGVEVLAYGTDISPDAVSLGPALPVAAQGPKS